MIRSTLTALGGLTLAAMTALPAGAQETRPNILVVLFDDVGFSGFGAYGGDARTPNIDALAQSGTLFSRYYSSPFCGPSRDPWDAANASAHWRKADEPQRALDVAGAALAEAGRSPKS